MRTHGENPWRRMRALGEGWRLSWSSDLPEDMYGYTDHEAQIITLAEGMSFEERRCTVLHEVLHAHRGPVAEHRVMAEELAVDRAAARLLLPSMKDVADCLVWAHGDYEAASSELWVDPLFLEVRLSSLWVREHEYLTRRLGDVIVAHE